MEYLFTFHGGKFTPSPGAPGSAEALEAAGYHEVQAVGNMGGVHYRLYEWMSDDPNNWQLIWVLIFSTSNNECLILCDTWPDLIDLLSKVTRSVFPALS